jgi:hypothetical protein
MVLGAAARIAVSTLLRMAEIYGDNIALHPVHQIHFKHSIADH